MRDTNTGRKTYCLLKGSKASMNTLGHFLHVMVEADISSRGDMIDDISYVQLGADSRNWLRKLVWIKSSLVLFISAACFLVLF